jgi:dihydroorotate dehydrogenase
VSAFGLHFKNPVGLAAGYDKDGLGWRGLACLGFGHIEIGTVTPQPQPGNPKPRLFRLAKDRALINRMGFPGRGAEFVAQQLRGRHPPGLVLGVNLGKNKDTPLEEAARDYLQLFDIFSPLATGGERQLAQYDRFAPIAGAMRCDLLSSASSPVRTGFDLRESHRRSAILVKRA